MLLLFGHLLHSLLLLKHSLDVSQLGSFLGQLLSPLVLCRGRWFGLGNDLLVSYSIPFVLVLD